MSVRDRMKHKLMMLANLPSEPTNSELNAIIQRHSGDPEEAQDHRERLEGRRRPARPWGGDSQTDRGRLVRLECAAPAAPGGPALGWPPGRLGQRRHGRFDHGAEVTGMSTEQEQLVALDQELKTLRADYHRSMRELMALQEGARDEQIAAFNTFHTAGLAYFNAHERAIPLDARLNMDLNPTCYTDRAETSANVLEVIGNHFETLRMWATDLYIDINTLRPSRTAFANMQRRVKVTQPEHAAELRERFVALDLPTRGFDTAESKSARADLAMLNKPQAIHYPGCAIGDGARVEAGSINSSHNGDVHVGDKINITGDVTGSAVGSNASVKARDIITQIQKSGLSAELKQKFAEAAEALASLNINEGDKSDAADDLAKLKAELEKPTKDEGRIRKIWNRIKEVAPTVASILASAVNLGKILDAVS